MMAFGIMIFSIMPLSIMTLDTDTNYFKTLANIGNPEIFVGTNHTSLLNQFLNEAKILYRGRGKKVFNQPLSRNQKK